MDCVFNELGYSDVIGSVVSTDIYLLCIYF